MGNKEQREAERLAFTTLQCMIITDMPIDIELHVGGGTMQRFRYTPNGLECLCPEFRDTHVCCHSQALRLLLDRACR